MTKVGDRIKVRFEINGSNRWYSGTVTRKARGVTSVQFMDGIQEFKGASLRALTKKKFDHCHKFDYFDQFDQFDQCHKI